MEMIYTIDIWEEVKRFMEKVIARYDVSKLENITFVKTKQLYVNGFCSYPISIRRANRTGKKKRTTFNIKCRVPEKPMSCDYTWVKKWKPGIREAEETETLLVEDRGEHTIWLFGHEICHFLRKTRQVDGRNTQNRCDKFGIELVKEYRNQKGDWKNGTKY